MFRLSKKLLKRREVWSQAVFSVSWARFLGWGEESDWTRFEAKFIFTLLKQPRKVVM